MKTLPDNCRELAENLACAKLAKEQADIAYHAALDAFTLAEPEGAQGFGVRVTQVLRAGAVAYAQAIRDLLPGADLKPYRGEPSLSYRVEVVE